jgi:hypothetical protein
MPAMIVAFERMFPARRILRAVSDTNVSDEDTDPQAVVPTDQQHPPVRETASLGSNGYDVQAREKVYRQIVRYGSAEVSQLEGTAQRYCRPAVRWKPTALATLGYRNRAPP